MHPRCWGSRGLSARRYGTSPTADVWMQQLTPTACSVLHSLRQTSRHVSRSTFRAADRSNGPASPVDLSDPHWLRQRLLRDPSTSLSRCQGLDKLRFVARDGRLRFSVRNLYLVPYGTADEFCRDEPRLCGHSDSGAPVVTGRHAA